MPISFAIDGGYVIWKQRLDRPEVYLDTFAHPANDGIDLVHAVDAVDYCDLVVLDKA